MSYSSFDNQEGNGIFDSFSDRHSMDFIDTEITTIGISRFISSSFNWGYADAGIGLAFARGQWIENCDSYREGILGDSYLCDSHESSDFGAPFQGSAVLGKYAGIGLYYDAFLSLERDSQVQFGIVVPLGNFTK